MNTTTIIILILLLLLVVCAIDAMLDNDNKEDE